METAFSWLGEIIQWLGKLIPRITIVRCTHGGVRFRHGKKALEVKPGLIVHWPVVTEIDIIPVLRQTHNLPTQALMTKDGKKIVVSGVVIYHIKDVVAALSRNWDFNDTLNDITMLAIASVITSHDYQFILENITTAIQKSLTKETRHKLKPYGVGVYRTALTDFCTALVIKNIGSGGHGTVLASHNQD